MKIAIYGCADYGKNIMRALIEKEDIDYTVFIDNSVKNIRTKVDGIDVVSLYTFAAMYRNKELDKVIIPNYSIGTIKSMKTDLRKNGVKAEDVLIVEWRHFVRKVKTISRFSEYVCEKLPYIQYVSFEAAEKCNLNCKRCDHFSNLLKNDNSENIDNFLRDIELLSSKVECIGVFSFLGGEPLLNDDLDKFLYVIKKYYPETQSIILTNGLLLRQMSQELIKAIKDTNTIVKMTLYPPLKSKIDDIVEFMRQKEIKFELSKVVDEFWSQINIEGDSNAFEMQNICVNSDCVMLKRGKLAKCPISMNGKIFNEYFGTDIPQDVLDLADQSITLEDLRRYLYNPISTCAYCGKEKYYEWEQTEGIVSIDEMKCLQKV